MLAALVEARPAVVSFHFGLPGADRIAALKQAGCLLLASATSLAEADAARVAGIDAVVAQGFEAGGHRGMFDPDAPDEQLGTLALTRLLARRAGLPVIAAGGIMDGAGIRAALALGAVAAQLGTAFVGCPGSGRRRLPHGAGRRTADRDDPRHLRPPGARSGQPLHHLGESCGLTAPAYQSRTTPAKR
jgi:nitronate monooxygenase